MIAIDYLLGLGLAAYYCTYVITESSFPPAEWLRETIYKKNPDGSWFTLVTCSWCVSAYTAAAVVAAVAVVGSVPIPVVAWLATAAVSALIALVANHIMQPLSTILSTALVKRAKEDDNAE